MKHVRTKESAWLDFVWPDYHLYQAVGPMLAWSKDFARVGSPLSQLVVAYSAGTTTFYVRRGEFEQQGKKYFLRVMRQTHVLYRVLAKVDKVADRVYALCKKFENLDFSKLNDAQLLRVHRQLFVADEALWRYGQIQNLVELHNNFLTLHVRKAVRDTFGKQREVEVFKVLTTPSYVSMTQRQDQSFVELCRATQKLSLESKALLQRIKAHARKYCWMNYGWSGPALKVEYFFNSLRVARGRAALLRGLQEKVAAHKQVLVQQKQMLRRLGSYQAERAELLRALVDSKLKRVDAHSYTYYIGEQVIAEIGKRVGLSLKQMRAVLPRAVPKLFKRVDVNAINAAVELVVYWFSKRRVVKLVGKAAQQRLKPITRSLETVGLVSHELRGELAYPGKVRGVVSLVLDKSAFSSFRKGRILVTRITDPSFVPIMKLAKAIVTDIGGVTSHAAIVSRELRVPCVVGTKNATRVLKSGDVVEVDATHGIVKRVR